MKILGNLRDGGFRTFQLFYDGPGQGSTDMIIGRFLRGTFYNPVQILRRHTQLRGIPSDGVLLMYMGQQKPDELFEQEVLTTCLRKFPVFILLPDMLIGHIHHEHPKRTLQHFCLEMVGIVLKNLHDTFNPLQKKLHNSGRHDGYGPYLYLQHIRRRKRRSIFQQRGDERGSKEHHIRLSVFGYVPYFQ